MTVRAVEGKQPYTGGQAIDIDENKVISLKLRDENNLIIYDSGDDEIYVDLQLPDEITPTDAFPVGVTTGRVIVDNGWDAAGTLICAKTTSGDNIKILYEDNGTLWIDNGTGTFKQIYFKSDVDAIITTLTTYINTELAKKQNGVTSDTAPSNPSEGDLWYDTANSAMKVWDGTAWQSVGTGGGSDIVYATQAEYTALLPGAASDGKHYFIYSTSGGGGWQPGVNTIAYYPLDTDFNDASGNNRNLTNSGATITTVGDVSCGYWDGSATTYYQGFSLTREKRTISMWIRGITINDNVGLQIAKRSTGFTGALGIVFYSGLLFAADGAGAGTSSVSASTNTWYYAVSTQEGSVVNFYVNGVLIGTENNRPDYSTRIPDGWSLGSQNSTTAPAKLNGYMSNVILEDKVWTAQEVADYYNQTKATYGIS